MRSKRFIGVASVGVRLIALALLTRMSIPPKRSTALATAAATAFSSRMSVGTGSASPPWALISSAAEYSVPGSLGLGSVVLATSTMRAPSRAAFSAIASPMPRDAPVMKRVLSFSDFSALMRPPGGSRPAPAPALMGDAASVRFEPQTRLHAATDVFGQRQRDRVVHRSAWMKAVAGHAVAIQLHAVKPQRRHVAAVRGALADPTRQCAVVPPCIGPGHPAQRLRQRREFVDRRQRAVHHVLHADPVAQQVGDVLACAHRMRRRDLVDHVVDAG